MGSGGRAAKDDDDDDDNDVEDDDDDADDDEEVRTNFPIRGRRDGGCGSDIELLSTNCITYIYIS